MIPWIPDMGARRQVQWGALAPPCILLFKIFYEHFTATFSFLHDTSHAQRQSQTPSQPFPQREIKHAAGVGVIQV